MKSKVFSVIFIVAIIISKNETFLKFNNPENWSTTHITFQSNTLIVFKKKWILTLKVVFATFLLVYFICLKESTLKTRANVFYFFSEALFVFEIIKF